MDGEFPQSWRVTARLPGDIKARFEDYVAGFGISGSALASLLVVRELRLRRLSRCAHAAFVLSDQSRLPTVSAYLPSALALSFRRYCDSIGALYGPALTALLVQELEERWLDGSLNSENRLTGESDRLTMRMETESEHGRADPAAPRQDGQKWTE